MPNTSKMSANLQILVHNFGLKKGDNMEAKAGDGLPKVEYAFIKYMLIPILKVTFTWNIALKFYRYESDRIKKIVDNLDDDTRKKRVKIDKVFGRTP